MSGALYIGIDLGGTNLRAGLVDEEGHIIGPVERAGTRAAEGPEAVMARMVELARRLLERPEAAGRVRAVGVGAPGPLDSRRGLIIYTPNLPGFEDYPVAGRVAEATGLPTFLENDANCACYGEFWVGAGRGVSDMVILTLGTGVGGGMVLDGRLRRGPHDTAGHLGHIVVRPGGRPCGCGGRGCLEQYASATAVLRRYRELLAEAGATPPRDTGTRQVAEAAARGEPAAQRAFREAAEALGWALVTIANTIDPELAVIGGGLAGAGPLLLPPAEEILRRHALYPPRERMRVEKALLGDDAGIIGAAGCARTRYATSP